MLRPFASVGRAAAATVLATLAVTAAARAPSLQPHGGAPAAPRQIQAKFSCVDGKSIEATFINAGSGSVRLHLSDGRRLTLPRAMSADGGRYADKADTIVFWNKGNTAFVQERRKTTFDGCSTMP